MVKIILPLSHSNRHVMISDERDGISLTVFDHRPRDEEEMLDGTSQVYVEARGGEICAYVFDPQALDGASDPVQVVMQPCPEAQYDD